MAEASEKTVRTLSIGFNEEYRNELPYARAVAKHLGTDHIDDIVTIDAIDLLPKLAFHFDEPFGDPSALPTYRVAELAARDLKVVLTGDGGDESFGGYTRYLRHSYQHHKRLGWLIQARGSRPLSAAADAALARMGAPARLRRQTARWRRLAGMDPDNRYVERMSVTPPESARRLSCNASLSDQSGYLLNVLSTGADAPLDRILRADLLTYLPEDLLVKVDRACMANSLEARSPLLDHEVVEFAARLPTDLKTHGLESKVLLRAAAKTLLPANLVDRPKMGFAVPLDEWFSDSLGDAFSDLVLGPDSISSGYIDVTEARLLLERHRSGDEPRGHRLWVILMFEQWARTWLRHGSGAVESGFD
jgi:asparagine synthase (glutamine-hydrolysing)